MNQSKILVVEDDTPIAEGLRDLLQSEDYVVSMATTGKAALSKIKSLSPDLMLLDVNLPDLNGFEICRQARKKGYAKLVIMLTSRTESIDKVMGLEVGADDYITKPFDTREILARIRAHLRIIQRFPSARPATGGSKKLLAIMFTDMKGFSKKVNADERAGLLILKRHNKKLSAAISRHGGKVIEIIGDAFVASFASAMSAVDCACAIQIDLKEYNLKKPSQEQIHVRIGIHIGDVSEDEGRLRGETVNIAARLQQISKPDHVTVSESVYGSFKGRRLSGRATRLGVRKLKNIRQPLIVYSLTV